MGHRFDPELKKSSSIGNRPFGAQFVTMLPASVLRFSNSDQSLKVPIKLPVQRRPVGVGTLKMARAARQQDFSLSAFTELQ